mmetsp:Transcript_6780/g.10203  ORF Transcript_6780/g.10203 Transcript_6780/m.10203 type:complete len:675 (+) Transcript_6780:123-2147(+)|eukprot:CAMPEP_0185035794 /NCGR_PEP_ID=MMETSP1103-20130426/27796_1 /TAXON_ID=36769 /ORGANISM="Paraphysomonas bandaiensis, Strain Caron Lab Isolate" /LENGTH=674 /DNA_ID=CAMNT_0027573047 /DNA_START=121 /DNA_END=2145 /DNA_ORIENTATION=-
MIAVGLIIVFCVVGLIGVSLLSLLCNRVKNWFQKRRYDDLNRNASLSGNLVRDVQGSLTDHYKLSKTLLGRGASAECYMGIHIESRREYAIKTIDTRDERVLKFYEKEIQILKDLEHLNIVRLYEVYNAPNSLHFVMELCVGGHLGEALALRPEGCFDEVVAQSYIAQLVGAVAHCHYRGICHRDIKLQNILLESRAQDAQIKLIDFGNSKKFTPGADPPVTFTKMAGTTYTMAPEVFKGEYDERCDIWSIGVVSYILLSGQRPFESIDIPNQPDAGKSSLVANILMGRYDFHHYTWDRVGDESIRFTQMCLTMDYKHRPTAAELQKNPWCSPDVAINTVLTESTAKVLKRRLSRASSTGLGRTSMIAVAFSMPSQKARELRSLFQQIDVDGSGQVDREEFKVAVQSTEPSMPEEDINVLFDAIDQDGNGQISFLEFVAAMIDPREVDINEVNQAFRLLDLDNKGYITHADLYRLLATTPDSSYCSSHMTSDTPSLSATKSSSFMGFRQNRGSFDRTSPCRQSKELKHSDSWQVPIRPVSEHRETPAGNISLPSSENEFTKEHRRLRLKAKVREIIEQADQNGDGKISYAEFVLAMTTDNCNATTAPNTYSSGNRRSFNSDEPRPIKSLNSGEASESFIPSFTSIRANLPTLLNFSKHPSGGAVVPVNRNIENV